MKKVMLVIRQGFDADYICSHLPEQYDYLIITETGSLAKKKKLRNMFHRGREPVSTILDLIALYFYDRVETLLMRKVCKFSLQNRRQASSVIEDINCPELSVLEIKYKPDVMIIYGTGIVKKKMIEESPVEIFNIHSSVLPAYRNVHSDFWAYNNEDYDKIGITIFKLSAGVDTGDIALQIVSELDANNRLFEYKAWNLEHIPVLIDEFLKHYFDGKIEYRSQNQSLSSRFETPTASDIFRFFRNSRNRKNRK